MQTTLKTKIQRKHREACLQATTSLCLLTTKDIEIIYQSKTRIPLKSAIKN